jgi:hypothetical protein
VLSHHIQEQGERPLRPAPCASPSHPRLARAHRTDLDIPAAARIELLSQERLLAIARKLSQWNVAVYQSSNLSAKLRAEVEMTRKLHEAMWERVVMMDGV